MNRLCLVGCVLLVSLGFAARLRGAERPNVVLIVLDDYGWKDSSCYGSTYYKTPNIDRLAKEGVRFAEFYAACPVCSPTRASILTGKYPQRYGLTDWLPGRGDNPAQRLSRPELPTGLPLDAVTLAESLKAAGYATGHIGKWHLGGAKQTPQDQGFDTNVAGDHTGTPMSYFAPFKNKNGTMRGLESAPDGEYLTDRLAAEAEKFIATNKDKPFFLYLPHYAPHTPLRAKADVIAKYKEGRPGTQGNPVYAAMVESTDDAVGRVMKALDNAKLADKTLVIFTSDNGGLATQEGPGTPATINAPLREGKGHLYEGGVRIPFIVRGPGVGKPAVTPTVACSIDIAPTVLDLCGVTSSEKYDGVSLKAVLNGGTLDRAAIYWHYPHYANQGSRPAGAIRAGEWKLIEFYESNRRELFNIKADLSESRNLAAEKPEVVKELAGKLAAWRSQVGAKMPLTNPAYKPSPQAADGTITLLSKFADVHGTQLRFEPLPHKNTLGFWTKVDDFATFDFTVTKPGTFTVEVLQGCGKGSGGSDVEMSLENSKLTFTVKDTGGFQAFEAREVGTLTVDKPGRHVLTVKPLKKPGVAVMDLRQVVLKPVAK